MKGTRGFLFTALALVLLTFMLASLNASSAAASEQEKAYAYRFKVEALNSMMESTNDAQLSNFAQMSLQYSLSQLAKKSVGEPLHIEGAGAHADNAYTGNVNVSLYELMMEGSTRGGSTGFGQPLVLPSQDYALERFEQALNASANAAGFSISFGEARGFDAYQIDAWNVRVEFSIPLNISDREGSFFVQKVLHANATASIEGIYDPMVAHEDMGRRNVAAFAQKQIFRNPAYEAPASVAPRSLVNESSMPSMRGLGWAYGPIMEVKKEDIATMNLSEARASIYMSTYYEGIESDGELFAGVIIRTPVTTNTTVEGNGAGAITRIDEINCVNCRHWIRDANGESELDITNKVNFSYIVTDGADWYVLANPQIPQVNGKRSALFDNEHGVREYGRADLGYHRIFDIEKLRDMAVCGFYVQNGSAPSFFQKMTDGALLLHSPLGIESFVVGKWAGGGDNKEYNGYSRLDRKFYAVGRDYVKIKGMPGCKNKEMCSAQEAIEFGVGHFGLDRESIEAYGVDAISCSAGGC